MNFLEFCKIYRWLLLVPIILLIAIYAPIYPRMFGDWSADPNYSHGFLVPLISGWFVWKSWPELKNAPVRHSSLGFILIIFGMLLLFAGLSVNELYTSRTSSIFILAGIVQVIFGTRVLMILGLPIAFLFFMVPLPYTIYDAVALPLRHLVSVLATEGLKLFGFPVLREGNVIILPNISLEVVEACSGMRSLFSLMALGTAYAFIFLKGTWRRVVLILATIPIAVITNVIRVFATGVLARYFGSAAAEGFFHDFAGFVVFAVAMALTALTGLLLGKLHFKQKGADDEN